jgi:methionine-rich copper-binding protein CopC
MLSVLLRRHGRRTVGLLTLAALPLAALAHPRLVSAVPAPNSRVTAPPAALRLTFQEAVETALSRVTLRDAAARTVALRAVLADSTDAATLVATPAAALTPGRYTVTWQAAGRDGHPMRGSYVFDVLAPAAAR